MIYLDSSVALAHLLTEERSLPEDLWAESLVSSRLLEYEIWTRIHAQKLTESHGESVRALLGRIAIWNLCHAGRAASCVRRVSAWSWPAGGTGKL